MSYEIENVTKKYEELEVLTDISFQIKQGDFICILGRSGSGKSTLLSLLGILGTPTKGEIKLNGKILSKLNDEQLVIMRREEIGIVFQDFKLFNNLTVIENVELALLANKITVKQRRDKIKPILQKLGILDKATHFPTELSSGERQRVGIARAFSINPSVLIADEPTGNLDFKTGKQILDLLIEINSTQNTTVIMVTHDDRLITERMRVFDLHDGHLSERK